MSVSLLVFSLSVCMNTQSSAYIKARDTKFGIKVSEYYTQIKSISYFMCHAYRPRKSVFCNDQAKYISN